MRTSRRWQFGFQGNTYRFNLLSGLLKPVEIKASTTQFDLLPSPLTKYLSHEAYVDFPDDLEATIVVVRCFILRG